MGYTHYYRRVEHLSKDSFISAAADCKKVCESSGIEIAREYDQHDKLPEFNKNLIRFNGIGDNGHETFYIARIFKPQEWQKQEDSKYFEFCKTERKPYDLCVAVCLIVLKYYLEDDIDIITDGDKEDWHEARILCQNVLGYGKNIKHFANF